MSRFWLTFLGVGTAAALTSVVVPEGAVRTGVVVSTAAAAAAAVVVGTWRGRPSYELPWVVLALGLSTFLAAEVLAGAGGFAVSPDGVPGWADLVHLAAYPCLVASLLLVHLGRDHTRDWLGVVDAAMMAVTAGLGYWVFVVGPRASDGTGPHLVAGIYLFLDVLLLTLVTRLVVAGLRQPAFSLVAAAVAVLLASDVTAVALGVVAWTDAEPWLRAGWLLSGVLWAAAALHPTMGSLTSRSRAPAETGVSATRLALLGSLLAIPPLMIGLQHARGDATDVPLLVAGLLVLVVLVLVRVGLLMQAVGARAERERSLRSAAAAFLAAGDREGVRTAALDAVGSLLGQQPLAVRLVDVGESEEVDVVAAPGGRRARVRGGRLVSSLLRWAGHDPVVRARVEDLDRADVEALGLRDVAGPLVVRAVRVNEELLALLVVVPSSAPDLAMREALDTLGSQLALALESDTLSAELDRRQGEARFRALVQNSSDAILLLDREARVSYQSASCERVLGYAPGTLVGVSLERLSHHEDLLRFQTCLIEVLARRGLSRRIELRLRRGDGQHLDTEAIVHNLEADANVGATLVTIRDISERKKFEKALTHQAFHDELTGLANRALFGDRVAHALRRRERDGTALAVLLLDLDDFKTINDGLGHSAGDAMLRAVAERLQHLVRPGDTTARLGGDEFAMVLVDLPSEESAITAVERIIATLGDSVVIDGREVFVQASIGVAFATDGQLSPDELLRNADAAMYVVKTDGKGRFAIFEPHMHAAAVHRLDLRADLQRALDNDEFVLHYQPIVSMATGRVSGVEALIRWEHPQRGLVPPDAFIPLAEETGLVVPLGRWVLEEACRQAAAWGRLDADLTMSINVSQRQLRRSEFEHEVGDALTSSGVDPGRVNLEITESAVMTDVESTIRRLHELKALGIRISVDDFGTGYSSLSWLRQLPLDVLKIDKEFVAELGGREESGFLVATIIDLAHDLGLRTVAEGIERLAQLDRLRHMHCDLGQGFHVGRPMPADAVVDLLARERVRAADTG